MNKPLQYRVNAKLKTEYNALIEEKYGHKRNRCGRELENAMKLQLVVNGRLDYVDDPNVQELLEAVRNISYTHTQNLKKNNKESNDNRIQRLEEKIDQLQVQLLQTIARTNTNESDEEYIKKETLQKDVVKRQIRYSKHKMDEFVASFLEAFSDNKQVSTNELKKLVINIHGVTDPRSIQNRIDYLKNSGYLEPYAPNIYNLTGL